MGVGCAVVEAVLTDEVLQIQVRACLWNVSKDGPGGIGEERQELLPFVLVRTGEEAFLYKSKVWVGRVLAKKLGLHQVRTN